MKEIVTKLYIDTGLGFNEEQTITQAIDSNCNKVEFMFNPLSVNMLRFVPINGYSVIHVSSIAIVREDNSSYKLGNYQTNALCQKNNDLIFTAKDPQIDLNIFNQKIKKVIINLIYIAIGEQCINYIPKFIGELIHEQDMLLSRQRANEARINQLYMQIEILKHNVKIETSASIISNYYRILKNEFKTFLKHFDPQYKLIKKSGLFDLKYYLEQNPDVNISNINALTHYIDSGASEGRNPNPLFDSAYYINQNPKIVESDINPLAHYIEVGSKEGRNPSRLIEKLHKKPKISIITPVYNADKICLKKCIFSVLKQIYNNWELCLVDDGSTKPHIKTILEKYAKKDPRVKVKFLKENQGIAKASNAGLSLATGEFICFLDHDDELTKDALYEVVNAINQNNADILYSDERLISKNGKHISFIYKPDFSPDLLFSHNYITHLLVVRKSMLFDAGGFSSKYEGAQDYDLIVRLTEKTKKICHIPKVLYNWRNVATSTSLNPEIKPYADNAGKMALEAALERRKIAGKVSLTHMRFFYRVKRKLNYQPLISIIIPFKDEPNLLKSCIGTIFSKTSYQNYEIIGINNNSEMKKTFRIINEFQQTDERIKFYEYNIPFNFSKINNYAVGLANGEHIVLMNNDIKIINSDWIEALLEHSQRREVGAVGAKLYYDNNTIQHAGIIIGIAGFAGHSHRHFKRDVPGYYNRLMCIQNVSAVTGALLMVKKSLYMEAGGLDEKNLTVALNDVDFCLRLRKMGFLNVFTPYCEAYHYESVSRGYEVTPEKNIRFNKETKYFQDKWKDLLVNGDPYYNPNLTLEKEDFSLKNIDI
ncbi:MAG: glycosyltransferase [Deltaproteobacteria bacterium]|jgi:GT2 family glycosyltransferase|nr:glycosyltransferase [Deltaproteobacteria bacterium]